MDRRFELYHEIKELAKKVDGLSNVLQNRMEYITEEEMNEWVKEMHFTVRKLLKLKYDVEDYHKNLNFRNVVG